jgi:hypothetical protein
VLDAGYWSLRALIIQHRVSRIQHRTSAATGIENSATVALSFSAMACLSFWKDKHECCVAVPTLALLDCICVCGCDSRRGSRTREK